MIVTKRESMSSLIHDTSPTLRHSLQQSHNKGLYYGFRDAIYHQAPGASGLLWCFVALLALCKNKNSHFQFHIPLNFTSTNIKVKNMLKANDIKKQIKIIF